MSKIKLMRIVLIVGSALIMVGVSLMCWMLATEEERNVIKVDLEESKTHTVSFESLGLLPGQQCEYVLKLDSEFSKKYDLRLDFVETEENTLKNYARVKIVSNSETVCDELLATVFDDQEIVLPVDLTDNKNNELTIVYYLPLEVGNEAKNAKAVFELLITASNK